MTAPTPADASTELIPVRLLELPLAEYQRSAQHHDELLREFSLIADDSQVHHEGERPVPARLLALVSELRARFLSFTATATSEREQAMAEGRERVDLVFELPRAARDGAASFDALLDEADEFCRKGELLTLATPPDIARFRRWYLQEFVRQIDGEAPTPWSAVSG